MDELAERLGAAIAPDPVAGLSREVVYADSVPADALVDEAATASLLTSRRLVLVRGLADLTAKAVERLRAAIEAGGADRRGPVHKLLPDAEQVEVRPPVGRAVPGWARERARALGLELDAGAAQTLVDRVGEDLGRLVGELEKAALHAGGERRVTEETVRALAGETRSRQYWELTQALEEGDRAQALRLLDHLLSAGDEPLVILAWVSGYLRDLWRVLGAAGESTDPRQIGRLLRRGRPDFAVQRLVARATAVGLWRLRAELRRCFEVERALKSSATSPRSLLTALVAELAR